MNGDWEVRMVGKDRTQAIVLPYTNALIKGQENDEGEESLEADIISILSDDHDSKKFIIVISAPPGPLGLILETNDKGPLICGISSDSPLIGLIEVGDIILSVDNVNAQNMDPTLFTKHVLKINNKSQRIIKVVGSRSGAMKRSELVSF